MDAIKERTVSAAGAPGVAGVIVLIAVTIAFKIVSNNSPLTAE
jgi:hypothetical protein